MNPQNAEWRKSRYSSENGGVCVEVAVVESVVADPVRSS